VTETTDETDVEADRVTVIIDVNRAVDHVTEKDHAKTTETTETANVLAVTNLARK